MAKDISCYIGFGPPERRKRSMKSTLNIPMTVLSWELKKSSWRRKGEDDEDLDDDGRTRWKGLYAEMVVNLEGADFTVCTGIVEIMDELDEVFRAKQRMGEEDMSFGCVARRHNGRIRLYPVTQGDSHDTPQGGAA